MLTSTRKPQRVKSPTSTRNITRTFRLTSPEDRAAGRAWYREAHRLATELDPLSPERAAAVLAVLSPRNPWERNVELARLAYELHGQGLSLPEFLGRWPGLKAQAVKAYRLLSGARPEDVVSGPKVTAFFRAIADPEDSDAIVIDRHAFSVAAGQPVDDRTRQRHLERKGGYEAVADQYRRAARIVSRETGERWSPAQVQAATWEHWRKLPAAA